MGPAFAGAAAAPAMEVAAASTIESGGRVLGAASGGAAAALAVGGGVASTVGVGGTPTVPAAGRVTGKLWGRALEALASEGGVGRERLPVAPGSVIFGNRGDHGERARACTLDSARIVGTDLSVARGDTVSHSERLRRSEVDWGCGHGSTDGKRAHAQLDSVVEAQCGRYHQQVPRISMWLPARGRLVCVPVPAVLNCLRPLSYPIALPHIFILTSFVISRGRFGNWAPSAFLYVLQCWRRTHATRRCGLD